jgi:hypothetical protein
MMVGIGVPSLDTALSRSSPAPSARRNAAYRLARPSKCGDRADNALTSFGVGEIALQGSGLIKEH